MSVRASYSFSMALRRSSLVSGLRYSFVRAMPASEYALLASFDTVPLTSLNWGFSALSATVIVPGSRITIVAKVPCMSRASAR